MQSLAAEFNLSETTFVLPPADAANTARVRIFNRTAEMPFAGHPMSVPAGCWPAWAAHRTACCASRRSAGLVEVRTGDGGTVTIAPLNRCPWAR
jgi:trans-2,3-dihydro-3-hydroxyanthranilate isomerase